MLRHPRIGHQVDAAPAVGHHGGRRRAGDDGFAGSESNDPSFFQFVLSGEMLNSNNSNSFRRPSLGSLLTF